MTRLSFFLVWTKVLLMTCLSLMLRNKHLDVAMVIPIIVTDLRCISVIYCKIYCYTQDCLEHVFYSIYFLKKGRFNTSAGCAALCQVNSFVTSTYIHLHPYCLDF